MMDKQTKIYDKMPSDLSEQAKMTDDELNLSHAVLDGKSFIKQKEDCIFLPDRECTLSDIGTGCLNWCRKRGGYNNERPPFFAHGREWSQDEAGAIAYEAFIKACSHDETWTERGCDGVVAFEITRCLKCDLELSHTGQQVWGDVCV
jgi:hypothetical protein